MRISLLSLLMGSLVSAQFETGIIFSATNAMTAGTTAMKPTQASPTTYIVNEGQSCRCVLLGTCAGNGIDIRIVNIVAPCPAGQEVCCSASIQSTSTTTSSPVPADYCGVRRITPTASSIVGQASFGAYPWQAAILAKPTEGYLGSGVLLTPIYVVTAAHKVLTYQNNPAGLLVRLGVWNGRGVNNGGPYDWQTANVASVTLHPNFNSVNLVNDVAVLRLNANVPIASFPNINTACRPTAVPAANSRCFVSGWGKNAFGPNGQYQSIMREVQVPIVDAATCEARLRQTRLGANFVLDKNSFICAGGEAGKDACTGDGGSPLVCSVNGRFQVVGLVAWGIGCANTNVPGVYTNFFNFLTWIDGVIKANL